MTTWTRMVCLLLAALAQSAWAEPGYRWEMSMQMDGMAIPGMGGGSSQCLPAKGGETPGMDEKCTLLESRRTGSRYRWKARCDGALSTGDFTYLGDSAYSGTVTVEEGGEKMTMKMSGKRLGPCDYRPPKIAMPDMTASCDQAVRDLEPELVFAQKAQCANRKKDFCARLNGLSPESYARVADRVKYEEQSGRAMVSVRMTDALKSCGVRAADLQAGQCRRAVAANDCDFIGRYCPNDGGHCAAGRAFSGGRAFTAGTGPAAGGAADPVGAGLNKLKGLFGF